MSTATLPDPLFPITLRGSRLLLREFVLDDWPAIHAYAARPEVCRFQPWGPNTIEETRAYVTSVLARAQEQPRISYTWAVMWLGAGVVIGVGGIDIRSTAFRAGEISYMLHPDYWGRGIATEVAALLVGFGFARLRLHRIQGSCDPRNAASERVMQKIGMRQEGRLRETMLIRDGWRDTLVYSLLEHEWSPVSAAETVIS